jgi:hypothetical protein
MCNRGLWQKIWNRTLSGNRCFFLLMALQPLWALAAFQSLELFKSVGLLGRVISSSQGLCLNMEQHKYRINIYSHQTFMPEAGFEPMITASERAKTFHALDRSATVTGNRYVNIILIKKATAYDSVYSCPNYIFHYLRAEYILHNL